MIELPGEWTRIGVNDPDTKRRVLVVSDTSRVIKVGKFNPDNKAWISANSYLLHDISHWREMPPLPDFEAGK